MAPARFHYLDACRALFMLCGIPYHVSLLYAGGHWGIDQGVQSKLLTLGNEVLSLFRMPAFFLIAGFFAALTLQKRENFAWLENRIVRLGVPLLFATICILPLQMLAMSFDGNPELVDGLLRWKAMVGGFGPQWEYHLWFLRDLLIYSAVLALFWPAVVSSVARLSLDSIRFDPFLLTLALILVLASPLIEVATWISVHATGFLVYTSKRFWLNAVFFLLGIVLFLSPEWRSKIFQLRVSRVLLCLALLVFCAYLNYAPGGAQYAKFLEASGAYVLGWLIIAGVHKWADRPSPLVAFFVSAAFTIYLVHLPFVMLFAHVSAALDLPPVLEFTLLCVAVLAASVVVHLWVQRSPVRRFLFNGEPIRKTEAGSETAAAT